MSSAIVVLSGGLDSTAALASMLDKGHRCATLSVDYGQRHRRELTSARVVSSHYGVEHQVADLSALRYLLAGSCLTSDIAVPHGHYAEASMKATVVPNRNMLLLAVAGAWAIGRKADAIVYGAHAGDHAIYPDCRPEFAEAMACALGLADWHHVEIWRPFVTWTKADIVREGLRLQAPLGLTYSCYEGRVLHCGRCGTCVERAEAFALAGAVDPTEYE